MRESPAVCVLGMHRSGTSCLAGSLQEAGLYLGEVVNEAPYNRKGNRESLPIRELHEDLLSTNGGSWDRPPAEMIWSAEHRARRDALIATCPADTIWGFKDPRTLLVFAGWREALPAIRPVGTVRHPLAVAASLGTRDGFTVERALALWTEYNRRLLGFQRELGFDIVSFDLCQDRYHRRLTKIAAGMGLAAPAGGFTFFDPALRRSTAQPDAELPAATASIYRRLLRIAEAP